MIFNPIQCLLKDKDNKKVIWYKRGYDEVKQDHLEVEINFDKIKKAISDPHIITQDVDKKKRKCYYLLFCGNEDYKNMSMKVVIEYVKYLRCCKIITAYFTNRIKPGEKIIWTKPKNN
ncbi:MAG: hypothetical protein ABIJ91_02350 [Candidatus Kuenenbacteria bacterium]